MNEYENMTVCDCCSQEIPLRDSVSFTNEYRESLTYCIDCAEQHGVKCDHCGDYFDDNNIETDDYLNICTTCYMTEYRRCTSCDRIIHDSDVYRLDDDCDSDPYCIDCYREQLSKTLIHNYSYKPEPIFYGCNSRFFGIELEVDKKERDAFTNEYETAANVLDIANHKYGENQRLYIKYDGSLNCGFELVSHPMSLNYHLKNMPWEEIMTILLKDDYLSSKVGTCGLHIHVNRTAFGSNIDEQDSAIARLLYLVDHHWEQIRIFSRRTQKQLNNWAAKYGTKSNPEEFKKDMKAGFDCKYKRHMCINITNADTIEFRIFRGTLKIDTFKATLQFVNLLCDLVTKCTDMEIEDLTWEKLVSDIDRDKYPELIEYLKTRNL